MLPDEVREAVDAVERSLCANYLPSAPVLAQWQVLRAHLLAREAEVEMLRAPFSDEDATAGSHWFGEWVTWKRRCERAEALLRACRQMLPDYCGALEASITAHLSENSRGDI